MDKTRTRASKRRKERQLRSLGERGKGKKKTETTESRLRDLGAMCVWRVFG